MQHLAANPEMLSLGLLRQMRSECHDGDLEADGNSASRAMQAAGAVIWHSGSRSFRRPPPSDSRGHGQPRQFRNASTIMRSLKSSPVCQNTPDFQKEKDSHNSSWTIFPRLTLHPRFCFCGLIVIWALAIRGKKGRVPSHSVFPIRLLSGKDFVSRLYSFYSCFSTVYNLFQ
jgi:hypothetical protein